MPRNIEQIFADNPASSMTATDLYYLGRSPFGNTNDMGITWNNVMLSITKTGTIGAGVWNATVIGGQFGGTGVANTGKTITLGGNLTTSGAFNTTFTFTGATSVTFPTSGTLSTTTGTVTSITAGSNLTGGTITTSGTIALSSTITGLTSLEVGNISFNSTFMIGTTGLTLVGLNSSSPVVLSPNNSFVAINDFGNTVATTLRFYNAAGTHYVGFKTTTGLAADTTWTWPTADGTSNQVLITNGSGQLSFATNGSGTITSITAGTNLTGGTITTSGTIALDANPANLTSINIAPALGAGSGITISANLITNISVSDLVIYPQGGHHLNLSPTLSGAVQLIDGTATIAVPLRFYNIAGTQYVGFKAGTLSGSTTWIWPTADTPGVMVSDGSANLSLTQSPSIYRAIVSVSGTSKTFALSDANTFQQCTNGSTVTLTVDTNANVAFPIGTEIKILQQGAGQVVFAAAGGVTIQSASGNLKIAAQYTTADLKKLDTNTWSLVGNLTA